MLRARGRRRSSRARGCCNLGILERSLGKAGASGAEHTVINRSVPVKELRLGDTELPLDIIAPIPGFDQVVLITVIHDAGHLRLRTRGRGRGRRGRRRGTGNMHADVISQPEITAFCRAISSPHFELR